MFARIAGLLGLPCIVAWGSRTMGHWIDSSDYDLFVVGKPIDKDLKEKAAEAGKKLGIKIDLFSGRLPSNGYFVDSDNGK